MNKPKFNLGDYLKQEPAEEPAVEQITLIDPALLKADAKNFYSIDGIDELAANIETVGLLDPLRVRPEGLGYTVVSGHRRREAIRKLIKDGCHMFDAGVPCIIEKGETSEAMRELRLIYANAATRQMSSADLSRQAERVTELLYKLKEEGVEFPGSMRNHVAEACRITSSKLARLHAIRANLDKPLLKMYDDGKINESVAYNLSQQSPEMQREICDNWTSYDRRIEYMGASYVSDYASAVKEFAERPCKLRPGELCTNGQRIIEKLFDDSCTYKPCKYKKCCKDCDQMLRCRSRCKLLDGEAKQERDKQRAESAAQRHEEQTRKEEDVRQIEQIWARYAEALRRAGTTDEELRASFKTDRLWNPFNLYMKAERVAALLDYSSTDTSPTEHLPFMYDFKIGSAQDLRRFADALGCSIDYLLCRTDVPELAKAAEPDKMFKLNTVAEDAAPAWRSGDPPRPGRYLCQVDMQSTKPHEQRGDWDGESWTFYGMPLQNDWSVLAWWPLPREGDYLLPGETDVEDEEEEETECL